MTRACGLWSCSSRSFHWRKRIMDKCPRCTRHYALDLAEYEQARQNQITASLDRFRADPSVASALEAHGQLLAFHDNEQASQFRATVLEKFPVDPLLRVTIAAQLDYAGAFDEAGKLYESALKQAPEMPEARVGVARRRMVEGDLDEARRLLSFLEIAGAGAQHDLAPLDILADYFQKADRHEEALALAAHLLRELPDSGQRHAFRSFVRKSEKALGRFESILPPPERSLLGMFRGDGLAYPAWLPRLILGGGAMALMVAGLLGSNEYIRRHRLINVVNACGQSVKIQVDDQAPVEVFDKRSLAVSEGPHHIKMTGAVNDSLDVNLAAGFLDRWFKKPLWVLNPGGEAVLQESTLYYAEHPQPGSHRLLVGLPFVSLAHIDYPFQPPPDQITLDSKNKQVEKTALQWIQGLDNAAFMDIHEKDSAGAIAFAERRLRRNPDQRELFDSYLNHTLPQRALHVEEFLKTGLDRRPVIVAWHRAYQAVAEMNGHDHGLIAYYDGLLKSEPSNGALIYLRGRIDPDWNKRNAYYQRASQVDPQLFWPWIAMGCRCAAEALWAECATDLEKANRLHADPKHTRDELHVARLATGGAEGLVVEYESRLAADAMDFSAVPLLTDALYARGQPEKVEAALASWANRLDPAIRPILLAMMRAVAFYQAGKLKECADLCGSNPSLRANAYRLQALLALGCAREAVKDPVFEKLWSDPWTTLAVSLAFELDGQAKQAAEWFDRGCKNLESLPKDLRRTAQFLRAIDPPSVESFTHISMGSDDRALVFALLGRRFPAKKAEYDAAAARFNISRKFPYQLVRRALGKMKPATR